MDDLAVLGFRAVRELNIDSTWGSKNCVQFIEFTNKATSLSTTAEWWSKNDCSTERNLNQNLFIEAMASCTEITYVNG